MIWFVLLDVSASLNETLPPKVRELFSRFGVAGTLLDNVVKSISSDDETLLKFMRKVCALSRTRCPWWQRMWSSPCLNCLLRLNSGRRRAKTATPS